MGFLGARIAGGALQAICSQFSSKSIDHTSFPVESEFLPNMFQFLGLAGCLWFASGVLTLHAATTVKMGALTQIRGAKDLDLEGEILYAINFSADDGPRKVRGITFLPDTQKIVGATLVGPQQVTSWQAKPEFSGML
jgi:hypothetical protein